MLSNLMFSVLIFAFIMSLCSMFGMNLGFLFNISMLLFQLMMWLLLLHYFMKNLNPFMLLPNMFCGAAVCTIFVFELSMLVHVVYMWESVTLALNEVMTFRMGGNHSLKLWHVFDGFSSLKFSGFVPQPDFTPAFVDSLNTMFTVEDPNHGWYYPIEVKEVIRTWSAETVPKMEAYYCEKKHEVFDTNYWSDFEQTVKNMPLNGPQH